MNEKPVLFLTYWYPSETSKSFGIFIKRHAQAISLHTPIIVLSFSIVKGKAIFKKSSETFKDERGVETHRIYLETRFYRLLFMLLPLHYRILQKYILANFKEDSFRLIHSNVVFPCGIVGRALAKKFGLRHIITEHWTKIDEFFSSKRYRKYGKKAFDEAAAITPVSVQLANTLRKYTNNRSIHVIPNVIDPHRFYFSPSIQKNNVLTFVAVSYWAHFKNPFYFLDALEVLHTKKSLPTFRMILAGAGPQIDIVKRRGYSFEIEYPGFLSEEPLNTEFNKSHIFLHGSDFETFSVVIAEALSCGLPAVLSPVGIGPEVINETNGFVTDNTPEDWQNKILICSRTSYNYGAIAEAVKNRYNPEQVGKQYSRLYQQVLSGTLN